MTRGPLVGTGVAIAVAAWLAVATPAAAGEDPTVVQGERFRVTAHGLDEDLAHEALRTVEAAWVGATALFGPPREPYAGRPLEVHVYRTIAGYLEADRVLANGAFAANLAFTHHATNTAHVALQPPLSDTALAVVGLPQQTRRLLAHEAAHVVRLVAMKEPTAQPRWFVDGAASWIADETLHGRAWAGARGTEPFTSQQIVEARRVLERQPGVLTVPRLLADDLDDLEMYERYSARFLFFAALAARREAFARFLAAARGLAPGEGFAARLQGALEAAYRGPELEEALASPATGPEPAWAQPHRALELRGTVWTQMAFPDSNAVAWRLETAALPYALSGEVEILPGDGRQANVLLGKSEDGFLSVALLAGHGITLLRYDARADAWTTLAAAESPLVRVGWRLPFTVRVAADRVTVSLGGTIVLDHVPEGRSPAGAWGLGTQKNTAVRWRGVAARPAP